MVRGLPSNMLGTNENVGGLPPNMPGTVEKVRGLPSNMLGIFEFFFSFSFFCRGQMVASSSVCC